jgi:uncharacterized membrane protein YjjP (DUF1212 family)
MTYEKDAYSGSAHEMHDLSAHNSPDTPQLASPEHAERRRVRINSSAAEIPGRPRMSSHSHIEHSETITEDTHTAEADELLRAHRQDDATLEHLVQEAIQANDDDAYGYSGNTQGGVFYQLLQAYKNPAPAFPVAGSETSLTPPTRPEPSSRPDSSAGWQTPRKKKWYSQEKEARSQETLATLVGAAAELANPRKEGSPQVRRHHKRNSSNPILSMIWKAKEEQDAKIKIHVASLLKRQQYIIKMCRALMLFGAPTHRLEEYLAMTAKVLEINSQFLYIPGCMIISFDDVLTHTAEVKIVRTNQGVNLAKLKDTHAVYKEVLHDIIDLDEATTRLDNIINAKDRHPVWLCVIMYGLASGAVSCFFKARLIDLPVIVVLGCLLGFLQLVVAPLSKTYSTVFEISAAIIMTCISRALGSIRGGSLFCFSALTQSSIAMILPGWLVLSSALELQSRAIVPGSIRLVFAIIYSLFLGYGITVGTALYGAMDPNATNETVCRYVIVRYEMRRNYKTVGSSIFG